MLKIRYWLMYVFSLMPFVHLPFVIWQFKNGVVRPASFTGNPIMLAGIMMVSLFFSLILFKEKRHLFFLYCSILSFVTLFLTVTHAAYLGVLFAFAFYVLFADKRTI